MTRPLGRGFIETRYYLGHRRESNVCTYPTGNTDDGGVMPLLILIIVIAIGATIWHGIGKAFKR